MSQNIFNLVRAAAGSEILAVIEGLPIDASGHFLSNEQMEAIENTLAKAADATALVTEAQTRIDALSTELTTAQDQLKANATQTTDAAANADDLNDKPTGWAKFETSVDQEAKARNEKFK